MINLQVLVSSSVKWDINLAMGVKHLNTVLGNGTEKKILKYLLSTYRSDLTVPGGGRLQTGT